MEQSEHEPRDITVYIDRYDPERDEQPRWRQEYALHVAPGMTVLDGLHALKETSDSTICYRFSCRMAVCGSCGMMINGRPALACNTQILEVTDRVLTVAPMPNFDVVRDLVPDLGSFFQKHKSVLSHLRRPDEQELENPTGEYFQSPEQLLKYLQFSYCIRCALCVSACPTVATDDGYLGPMALAQAHRYSADSRDAGFDARKQVVSDRGGAFSCHYAGECSNVCPKGVDPARAIQLLKRDLVFDYLRVRRRREPSAVLGPPEHAERQPDVPEAPPHTVETTD
ncbi:MAG: succinate dehydrogenase/fumarate reductase iron-sulfur subunit [Armatimonadota bacterium]